MHFSKDKKYKLAVSFRKKDEVSLPLCAVESSQSYEAEDTLIGWTCWLKNFLPQWIQIKIFLTLTERSN